jgi:bacterioferritin (cytochrome b1)
MSDQASAERQLLELLGELRRAEKEQALVYRALAARAELDEKPELAQRFHDLHADEQHHLSRLTARMLELDGKPPDLSSLKPPAASLEDWESVIRTREAAEIDRYRSVPASELDGVTRDLLEEILSVEEHHARELGGKWTVA